MVRHVTDGEGRQVVERAASDKLLGGARRHLRICSYLLRKSLVSILNALFVVGIGGGPANGCDREISSTSARRQAGLLSQPKGAHHEIFVNKRVRT